MSPEERVAISQLASDLPALWHAPSTTAADRKAIVRQVVQRVVLAAHGQSEQVQVTIEWVGGGQTQASVVRPVARLEQLSYYPQLCARAQQLTTEGLTMAAIAARLNAEGYRPPKRRAHFGAQGIQELLQRLGVLTHHTHQRPRAAPGGAADEWGLRELAHALEMPHVTLYTWLKRGWVTARREPQPPYRWIVWADAAERERLRQHHRRSLSQAGHQRWCARPVPDRSADAESLEA